MQMSRRSKQFVTTINCGTVIRCSAALLLLLLLLLLPLAALLLLLLCCCAALLCSAAVLHIEIKYTSMCEWESSTAAFAKCETVVFGELI